MFQDSTSRIYKSNNSHNWKRGMKNSIEINLEESKYAIKKIKKSMNDSLKKNINTDNLLAKPIKKKEGTH